MRVSRNSAIVHRAKYEVWFYLFARFVFDCLFPRETLVESFHINVVCAALARLRRKQDHWGLVLNLPPRTLKSIISSVAFPLHALIHNRDARIMVLAGTDELASELLKNLEVVLKSTQFRALFSDLAYRRVRSELRFGDRGSIQFSVYGRDIIGKGFDVCIIDDPQSPSSARDRRLRMETNSYFDNSVVPRMNERKRALVVVVQQRLHHNDLSGHLADRPGWRTLSLGAISTREEQFSTEDSVEHRIKGQPICAERETLAALQERLFQMGGNDFMAQYQQCPSPHDNPTEYRGRMVYPKIRDGVNGPEFGHAPALAKVSATALANHEVFGASLGFSFTDPKPETLEEWEAGAIAQQARLVGAATRPVTATKIDFPLSKS